MALSQFELAAEVLDRAEKVMNLKPIQSISADCLKNFFPI
jgi:hypothetical protein